MGGKSKQYRIKRYTKIRLRVTKQKYISEVQQILYRDKIRRPISNFILELCQCQKPYQVIAIQPLSEPVIRNINILFRFINLYILFLVITKKKRNTGMIFIPVFLIENKISDLFTWIFHKFDCITRYKMPFTCLKIQNHFQEFVVNSYQKQIRHLIL